MLRLLLDEHLSPDIVTATKRLCSRIEIISIQDWLAGHLTGTSDHVLLREAALRETTLVTFDRKTIPLLLRAWADQGIEHAGVIFIDEKTFPQDDIGGIARALW